MRYLKSAAFLLALLSSSATSLSRTATAAEPPTATPQSAESKTETDSTDPSQTPDSTSSEASSTVLDISTDPSVRPSSINQPLLAPLPTAVREPDFSPVSSAEPVSAKPMDLADIRRWLQAPTLSQTPTQTPTETPTETSPSSDDNLPTLEESEESAPPASNPAPAVPATPPASGADSELAAPPNGAPTGLPNQLTLEALPDSLLSDPNPLNVPTLPEDVNIERNPVVTLDQAVELAYRNNQALQTTLLTLEQAEASLQEAKASRLPTAAVGADLTNSRQGSISSTTLGGSVQVNYNLLTGGQREAAIRAAELQTQVSALAVEAQQEQIRLVTANSYYALQESGERIRINQSFVTEAEQNLRDSELRQEVGVGTRFDVLRADVQLANAQQQLVQSRFDQDIARRDISRLLNLPTTAGLQATPVAKAEAWTLNLDDSILLAFQNRSELEQLLLQSDINEQQRKIALAAIRPQVSLFANYGLSNTLSTDATDVFGNSAGTGFNDSTSSFGARFNLTLYDGGAARARARQQEIAGAINEEQFSQNVDQVRFDVEQSFFNLQANEENIATSRVAVSQAEEAFNLAKLRLQAGVGTQLDVLTAQSELTQAQFNNVTAILGYNRSLAALQRAVSNLVF
ncbi:MAG: TolC family protein [Phormidesmis sp.]